MKTLYLTFCFFFPFLSAMVFGQAQVFDPTPLPGAGLEKQNPAREDFAAEQPSLPTDFYYQMQLLQQDVLQLRGMVDEQAHEIKKLKQQRLDDYLDLDRRISKLGSGSSGAGASGEASDTRSGAVSSTGRNLNVSHSQAETQSYRAAIDLVLRKKDYKAATTALMAHLNEFPQGSTAANAHYWLGELYLKDEKFDTAERWFNDLLNKFPEHSKVPDSKYKLGQVLFLKGDKVRAREILDDVVQMGTSASNLARRFIANNY